MNSQHYVGEGSYSRSKDPQVYKIWLWINQKAEKDNTIDIDPEWRNFQIFTDWYYDNIKELNPSIRYVVDKNIFNWLSCNNKSIYSEESCCLLPRDLFDYIKNCTFQSQMKSELPLGVNIKGNHFETKIVTVDKRRIHLGLYESPEKAFYVYKYHKEKYIKDMADYYYSIGALQDHVYECLYSLIIFSIHVPNDNYNPKEIEEIMSKRTIRPIQIIDYKKFHEGSIYYSKLGGPMLVLEYIDKFNVRIKFLDEIGYETVANIDNILSGNVKNPFVKNKYGGYYGVGPYTSVKYMHVYKVWEGVLNRTNPIYNTRASYINTTICDEWRNFQIFTDWYVNYISLLNPNYKYQIDKDILQWNQEYKIYSPTTCCLIPKELNLALSNIQNNKNFNTSRIPKILALNEEIYHNNGIRVEIYNKIKELFI